MPYQSATVFHKIWYNLYEELYKHLPEDTIGSWIRKGRLSANLSQEALGKLLGVSRGVVGDYEMGVRVPYGDMIEKIEGVVCEISSSRK